MSWLTPLIPKLWKAEAGGYLMLGVWDQLGQHGETLSLLKIRKISWAWWQVPVISATHEAEVGESLQPGRRRLQWAEIVPLYSSLGDRVRLLPKKKNKKKALTSSTVKKLAVSKPPTRPVFTSALPLWIACDSNHHLPPSLFGAMLKRLVWTQELDLHPQFCT